MWVHFNSSGWKKRCNVDPFSRGASSQVRGWSTAGPHGYEKGEETVQNIMATDHDDEEQKTVQNIIGLRHRWVTKHSAEVDDCRATWVSP